MALYKDLLEYPCKGGVDKCFDWFYKVGYDISVVGNCG